MSAETRAHLTDLVTRALARVAPDAPAGAITFERPRDPAHGDYATTVALQFAKTLRMPPRKVAEQLVAALPESAWIEPPEIAGPGFINFRLKPGAKQRVARTVLERGPAYGRAERGQGRSVMIEFVSANPTGPLHVGHGRQAALGDAIAGLLERQGWRVTREFYYNDAGQQIQNLAVSVRARAQALLGEHAHFHEDGYHGEYIREIA
jgi:arginyl-tRNA synthetase